MTSTLDAARARLIAADLFMSHDYAWKENAFRRCERMTGVVCRLLYLYEVWKCNAKQINSSSNTQLENPYKVYIDANGYPTFYKHVAAASKLMGFDVITEQNWMDAQLVFVYVSPPGEERTQDQYSVLKQITSINHSIKPIVCMLLGETEFLEPPEEAETQRLRGLSGFAISQTLSTFLHDAQYRSIAQFTVEFTPSLPVSNTESSQLSHLMKQFGCLDHNMMEYNEKWEFFAHVETVLTQEGEQYEQDVRYWLEYIQGKMCGRCHEYTTKLSRCSQCSHAFYCSRECQKKDWKVHKQVCRKK